MMYERYIKRIIDFVIVFCVLLVIWPFLLVIIVLLLVFNEGQVLFLLKNVLAIRVRYSKLSNLKL